MMDALYASPLLTPAQMNAWDKAASHMGLTTAMLMENASREAYRVLLEKAGPLEDKSVLCLAGPGNNGGDAIALARHLHDAGARVTLALARPMPAYTGAAGLHLRLARRAGVDVRLLDPGRTRAGGRSKSVPEDRDGHPGMLASGLGLILDCIGAPDVVVDGLLGTGLTGEPRPAFAGLIDAVNQIGARAFALALDIPSGLSGETGVPASSTVIADATVTFEAAKLGLCLPAASPFVGELLVRRIGIPRVVRREHPASHYLLSPELARHLPLLDASMHKGSAGKVLVIGGSPGLTGAPVLAAMGAFRSGAGLVTVACPKGVEPSVKAGNPDVMTMPLGEGELWSAGMAGAVLRELGRFDALAVGPGMGRGEGQAAFLAALANGMDEAKDMRGGGHCIPTLWDADALFWLASRRLPEAVAASAVFTPHPGEAARILGLATAQVESARMASVRALAGKLGGAVALKGPATLVCGGPDGASHVFVSPFSEPNLAVGGSGDVLAGVAGSLLARGLSPLLACCLGVYWHGFAGRLVSGDFPYRGNLASEIARELPRALTEWLHAES
jgi:NAD(P)H-hydrate epimerase